MIVCDLCKRPYGEHAGDALVTANEHGWRWNKDACPIGETPFHPTQIFTNGYYGLLDDRDICQKCGEPINDEMGHMCPPGRGLGPMIKKRCWHETGFKEPNGPYEGTYDDWVARAFRAETEVQRLIAILEDNDVGYKLR